MQRFFFLLTVLLFALLVSSSVTACAEEDPPKPLADTCGGTASGVRCEAPTRCAIYAYIPQCVRDCTTTAGCGTGFCCSHRDHDDAPYCVPIGDPLGRDGAECLP